MTVKIPPSGYISNDIRTKAQIKQSFEEIRDAVDTIDQSTDQNTADIAVLKTSIDDSVKQDIIALENDMTVAQADIATNKADIAQLQTEITTSIPYVKDVKIAEATDVDIVAKFNQLLDILGLKDTP